MSGRSDSNTCDGKSCGLPSEAPLDRRTRRKDTDRRRVPRRAALHGAGGWHALIVERLNDGIERRAARYLREYAAKRLHAVLVYLIAVAGCIKLEAVARGVIPYEFASPRLLALARLRTLRDHLPFVLREAVKYGVAYDVGGIVEADNLNAVLFHIFVE